MKKLFSIFTSTKLMAILLFIFGGAIALATFIENDFGTDAARNLVYNAKWFEVLLVLGCINILAVIINAKLYKRNKLTLFAFHISFLFIILGAGLTRYFGREGSISIREGEITSEWMSTETHIGLHIQEKNTAIAKQYPVLFSTIGRNNFSKLISFAGHKIKVKAVEFLPAADRVLQNDKEGNPIVHLVTSTEMGRQEVFLREGQTLRMNTSMLVYTDSADSSISDNRIQIFSNNGMLYFLSPDEVTRLVMSNQQEEILEAGTIHPFVPLMLHYFDSTPLVLKQYMENSRIEAKVAEEASEDVESSIRVNVTCDGISKDLVVFGKKNQEGQYNSITLNGVEIGLSYGAVAKNLPFELKLNDFILKRYPGSESPSWFESNVQLIDPQKSVDKEARIYMNHILKHRGYRFYQSSYDTDEKGTVLSINRDGAGTAITYLGYLMMTLGMLLSLINRHSRFIKLSGPNNGKNSAVKTIVLLVLLAGFSSVNAQNITDSLPVIPSDQAEAFGKILVQDNGGRIEPINTLASEVIRKVMRKEEYKDQTPEQVLLGMYMYRERWQHEPMIRVSHPEIQDILELKSNYASFVDFFLKDQYSGYVLKSFIEQAHRKKPAYRSKFDNELIRVDERLNIAFLVYTGALFKVFPDPADSNHTWHSPITAGDVFSKKDSVFSTHILTYYGEELQKSMLNGDWKNPEEMVKAIKIFQSNYGAEVLPSTPHIHAEVFYNNANLFQRIVRIYLLLGLFLLLMQFIHIFLPRFSLRWIFRIAFILIASTFAVHTFALGLRWYIAGHAPWSNGYEALTFIAWSTVLAGIIFSRKSGIALSTTVVLAALILQTAHLSWMDPQITNLVPVLQSYWLVIHVAVITASYGFLGMGAILAAVNLLLMFFQNKKNYERLQDQIKQISKVIEMTLIVGLYLLTIGTFLGGVWANESWGRYWAWDPKETWALVTVIVYAIILHLRIVPGLKGRLLFNITALVGFASVIMTYFGVNYYLSGLHSYAAGDPLPIPPVVYYSVAVVIVISLLAGINQFLLAKSRTK